DLAVAPAGPVGVGRQERPQHIAIDAGRVVVELVAAVDHFAHHADGRRRRWCRRWRRRVQQPLIGTVNGLLGGGLLPARSTARSSKVVVAAPRAPYVSVLSVPMARSLRIPLVEIS